MRFSILAAPGVGMVRGTTCGNAEVATRLLSDRIDNRRAFPGERVVRVPRRITRDYHGGWLLGQNEVQAAAERSVR